METRLRKLEKWLSPPPIVPVHVHLILSGLKRHHDGPVYRENQFQENGIELLSDAVPCIRRLKAEHKNSDGQVIQRFFIYESNVC